MGAGRVTFSVVGRIWVKGTRTAPRTSAAVSAFRIVPCAKYGCHTSPKGTPNGKLQLQVLEQKGGG